MKNLHLVFLFAICVSLCKAQTSENNGWDPSKTPVPPLSYTWPVVNPSFVAPGTVGNPFDFTYLGSKKLASYTVSWTVSGTVTACSLEVDGSFDMNSWTNMDYAGRSKRARTMEDCTKSGKLVVPRRPWRFLSLYITNWKANAGATVTFSYAGVAAQL